MGQNIIEPTTNQDLLQKLHNVAEKLQLEEQNYYLTTYDYYINYFRKLDEIKIDNIIIGISFSYSWMPTIPKNIDKVKLEENIQLFNDVKNNKPLSINELREIKKCINNSIVGTSKLLHFINPNLYAIWDSKVYNNLHNKTPYHERLNKVELYFDYLNLLDKLISEKKFDNFHSVINKKLKADLTKYRALEYVIFKMR
jgi:hypothetical protein